jgi:HK97 gp10 family phage protein
MNFQYRITGASELDRVLKQLPTQVAKKELTGAVMAGADIVRKNAQSRAPFRFEPSGPIQRSKGVTYPGELKRSIRRRVQKMGTASVTVAVGIGRAFWGMFREFGTRHEPARPWFRPAWDESKLAALNKIGLELGKRIEAAAARLAGPGGRKFFR